MPPRITRCPSPKGPTVVTLEDTALPVVRFLLAYRGGAVLDPPDRCGLHMVTFELMMRGTRTKPRSVFSEALESLGSAASVHVGSEVALVQGVCLRRHLDATLTLVREALLEPRLDPDEFAQLVAESVEDLRAARDDDEHAVDHFLRQALYAKHPFARPPEGSISDLETLGVEEVEQMHQTLAPRERLALFAGALDPEEAERTARPLAANPSVPSPTWHIPEPKAPDALTFVLVDKPERTQAQLRIACPTIPWAHPDALALWLGITAFGGLFTAPFCREVRDIRGWSYTAQAQHPRRQMRSSPLVLQSAPALDDTVDCIELELNLFNELAQGRLAPEDLARAREFVVHRHPFEVATAGELLMPALQAELLGMPIQELFTFDKSIATVGNNAVCEALKRHLKPDGVVVVVLASADRVYGPLTQRFPHASMQVVDFRQELPAPHPTP